MVTGTGTAIIEASWFSDLQPDVVANIGVLVPVAVGILAVMIGVSLIPRIIRRIGRV